VLSHLVRRLEREEQRRVQAGAGPFQAADQIDLGTIDAQVLLAVGHEHIAPTDGLAGAQSVAQVLPQPWRKGEIGLRVKGHHQHLCGATRGIGQGSQVKLGRDFSYSRNVCNFVLVLPGHPGLHRAPHQQGALYPSLGALGNDDDVRTQPLLDQT